MMRDIPNNLDPPLGLNLFCNRTIPIASFQVLNKLIQPRPLLLPPVSILSGVINPNSQSFLVELLSTRFSSFLR